MYTNLSKKQSASPIGSRNVFQKNEFWEWLLEELQRIKKNSNVIILGDFIDTLSPNNPATVLIDVMKNSNLALSSKLDVTRNFGDSKSCIDQINSNTPVQWNHIFISTITDHYFVWTEFAITLRTKVS